jgi:hypothetical protein
MCGVLYTLFLRLWPCGNYLGIMRVPVGVKLHRVAYSKPAMEKFLCFGAVVVQFQSDLRVIIIFGFACTSS